MGARRPEILMIYPADCFDGLVAGWIADKRWGVNVEHLHEIPDHRDCVGRTAYLIDMSPGQDILEVIVASARKVRVLDPACRLEVQPGVSADPQNSGAAQLWVELEGHRDKPWIVEYASDWHLGRYALPTSRLIEAAVSLRPQEFAEVEALSKERTAGPLAQDGAVVLRTRHQLVRAQCERVNGEPAFGSKKSAIVNCSVLVRETLRELVSRGYEVVAAWHEDGEGNKLWTAHSETVDVSQLGAGHDGVPLPSTARWASWVE